MAMTGAGLKTARIAARAAVIADYVALAPLDSSEQTQLGEDLIEADSVAIIDYIKTNGQIVVTSVTGVTTGGGVSGPGTGTIT